MAMNLDRAVVDMNFLDPPKLPESSYPYLFGHVPLNFSAVCEGDFFVDSRLICPRPPAVA